MIGISIRRTAPLMNGSHQHGRETMRCFILAWHSSAAPPPPRTHRTQFRSQGHLVGKGKSIVFGTHSHHPGSQTASDPPRVRDIEATHVVEGQDGRSPGGDLHSQPPTPRSRSPGPSRATTDRSSAPTWTAIFGSPWSRPTGWRNAKSTTASAQPARSLQPAS